MQFQSIFSSLLISLTLVSTSMASLDSRGQHINHNAHARAHSSHAKMLQSRELYHSNSIPRARDVNGSRKMVRKATQEQLDYQEKFNKMNSEWQAAAQESLKNGQTPQDYDSFSKSHGGVESGYFSDGNSGSGSSTPSSSNNDSSESDSKKEDQTSKVVTATKSKAKANSNKSDDSSPKDSSKSNSNSQDDDDEESKASKSTSSEAPKKTKAAEKQPKKDEPKKDDSSKSKSGGSSNSGGGLLAGIANIFSGGEGTYFAPGLGSCGGTNSESDYIVAVSGAMMDKFSNGNPNTNPLCGKKIKVEYQGKEVEAEVVDTCPPCSYYSLDFSPSAFKQLADESVGRFGGMKWGFTDGTQA